MLLNPNQKWSVGSIVLLVLFVTLVHRIQHPFTTKTFSLPSFPSLGSLTKGKVTQSSTIPNIVHFVHLVRGSDSEPVVEFPFRQFVAIYSAHYHLNPDKIYIHTNLEDHILGAAINASTNPYVRVLLNIPNIVFNYEYTPLKTTRGKTISELAHRSDFIRTRVLKRWGGLYLDDDAYVVRDLRPLRESGFRAIAGRQQNNQICNAVIMAAPESELISLFYALQDRIFDGGWTTHSVDLLSRLAQDFSGVDGQMLILEREVFYRLGFNKKDLIELYHVYRGTRERREDHEDEKKERIEGPPDNGDPIITSDECRNMTEYMDSFEDDEMSRKSGKSKETVDWRGSYIIHGWTTQFIRYDDDDNIMFGRKGGITLDYILAKKSRFASAVYPAVKHAVDNGVLDGTAGELSVSSISGGVSHEMVN